MNIESLFTSPSEEVDLALLRNEINRVYRDSFKRMRNELNNISNPSRICTIVNDTINEVDRLIERHNDKHHPTTKPRTIIPVKEPF